MTRNESRSESDHAVSCGLSPDELTVWKSVRRFIVATAYASRAEVFAEWYAEHAGDVACILERAHERSIASLLRGERDAYAVDAGVPGDRTDREFHEAWEATPAADDVPVVARRAAPETSFFDLSAVPF